MFLQGTFTLRGPTNGACHDCIGEHIYSEEISAFWASLENTMPTLPVFHLRSPKRRAISALRIDPFENRYLDK
jgi:hypothetical protein